MTLPPHPVHPGPQHAPGPGPHPAKGPAAGKPPTAPKTAVLNIVRSDNGLATYSLTVDGKAQALKHSSAKWDDATPWVGGNYGAHHEPMHRLKVTIDAFLIKYPPNRSGIKFHPGTETGHSEGCIVVPKAALSELEKVLTDNDVAIDDLTFHVTGEFPIHFKLSIKGSTTVQPGDTITLTLELTGGGAPGGVSKDVWFHVIADTLDLHQYALVYPEKMPPYKKRSFFPDSKQGVEVCLRKGDRTQDFDIKLTAHPHAEPSRKPGSSNAAPAGASPHPPGTGPMTATGEVKAVFQIDNYSILNKAPGPLPYYYTPSDYKIVLAHSAKTLPITIKPAAPHP